MNDTVSPNLKKQITKVLRNKVILVTGGTGSFGKTIVKSLLQFQPKEIRVYSRSEDKQEKMRYSLNKKSGISYLLGDVRDSNQLIRATVGVDILFHAAAQKQVPASEANILEAIQTNIIGAQNVIDACFQNEVQIAIAISTDKAVEPVNVMGMTKALQEKLFTSANLERHRGACIFSVVRYGNVLGSTGSVLEVFLRQLNTNQPLEVTDLHMTRFLITLDMAVQLVYTALTESVGGEIFVPNIPAHTVMDLARAVYSVYQKKSNPAIHLCGIRPGEKIHETLISPSESLRTIRKNTHFIILPQVLSHDILRAYRLPKITTSYRYASDTTPALSIKKLRTIILEYQKKHPN